MIVERFGREILFHDLLYSFTGVLNVTDYSHLFVSSPTLTRDKRTGLAIGDLTLQTGVITSCFLGIRRIEKGGRKHWMISKGNLNINER